MSARLHARSEALLLSLETRLPAIVVGWLLVAALASVLRIVASPVEAVEPVSVAPYLLLILTPLASFLLALRWFADGERMAQPEFRLARVGCWRSVPLAEAMRHKLYGTSGIMVSLLIGMLLNVPIRAAEYLVTMPTITSGAPGWLAMLHLAMTVDVVVLSSLYVVAFVAALRRSPFFPRLLLLVWLLDLLSQLLIAHAAMSVGLPVGVASALHTLLDGNTKKVLISIALWLPYLLLSTRVNVTYRHRLPR
jgi:hypothetical protein